MHSSVYIFLFCNFVQLVWCIDPIVLTRHGLVAGLPASDGDYSMFLGIPYAKIDPENPFAAPLDYGQFENVFEAVDDSVVCPQEEDVNKTIVGQLDCLRVNVFVPNSAVSKNLLSVMVWIHGGSLSLGSYNRYSYGPKFIVKHDVLLVTINYRVGIYGFLCSNSSDIPGNAGLKDQLAALKWIKENIAAFGGDPDNITIFGESAGAASVEFHLMSELSNGLFHRAIMQSGTLFSDWLWPGANQYNIINIAMQLGLHTNDDEIALDFLKKAPALDVIKATLDLNYKILPCVETHFADTDNIFKSKPTDLFKLGAFKDIPILSGFNNMERLDTFHFHGLNPNYLETAGKTIEAKLEKYFDFTKEELEHASKLLYDFYIGDGRTQTESLYEMILFDSDFTYIHALQRTTSYYLSSNKNPIFQYMFAYSGERNYMKYQYNITLEGANHADDISYLFDSSFLPVNINNMDQLLIDRMTTMWTNFAKYNDPTPYVTDLIPIKWEPSDIDHRRFLVIDKELKMSLHPYHQRMVFWDLFFRIYGDKQKW